MLNPGKIARCPHCGKDHYPTNGVTSSNYGGNQACAALQRAEQRKRQREEAKRQSKGRR